MKVEILLRDRDDIIVVRRARSVMTTDSQVRITVTNDEVYTFDLTDILLMMTDKEDA